MQNIFLFSLSANVSSGNPGRTTVDLTIKAEREMDCKGSKATSNARCQNTHHGPRPTLVICPLSVLSNWQVLLMSLVFTHRLLDHFLLSPGLPSLIQEFWFLSVDHYFNLLHFTSQASLQPRSIYLRSSMITALYCGLCYVIIQLSYTIRIPIF